LKRAGTHILLFVIFLFQSHIAEGQKQKPKNESWYDEKPLHFGFSLGFNAMDLNITPNQAYIDTTSLYPEVSILISGFYPVFPLVRELSGITRMVRFLMISKGSNHHFLSFPFY
jgi:hypothetical protein